MLHHVKDLSPEQRRAVESLLGRPVSDDESVSIKGIRLSTLIPSTLPEEERQGARGDRQPGQLPAHGRYLGDHSAFTPENPQGWPRYRLG